MESFLHKCLAEAESSGLSEGEYLQVANVFKTAFQTINKTKYIEANTSLIFADKQMVEVKILNISFTEEDESYTYKIKYIITDNNGEKVQEKQIKGKYNLYKFISVLLESVNPSNIDICYGSLVRRYNSDSYTDKDDFYMKCFKILHKIIDMELSIN